MVPNCWKMGIAWQEGHSAAFTIGIWVHSLTSADGTNRWYNEIIPYIPDSNCKCTEIMGHLEEIQELLVPRTYKPRPGCLGLGDWSENHYEWPKHIASDDGLLKEDKYLLSVNF